jgi:hypothetical protein
MSNEQPQTKQTFLTRVASVFKLIKFELLIGSLALILSLGQYFQSGISIRINITSIWREGYTAETRDRVSKFRYWYEKWTEYCKNNSCQGTPDASVRKLASAKELFNKGVHQDILIQDLISDEIALLKLERSLSGKEKSVSEGKPTTEAGAANGEPTTTTSATNDSCITNDPCITNEDYVRAALKYRNAIIECLNTAEAVKAVIQSRPLPFRKHLLYSDTLEGRYNDIIDELTTDLGSFIRIYREVTPGRETPAWFVLTNEESNRNDYYVIRSYIFVFILVLTIIYFLKRLFQQSSKNHTPNTEG